MTLETRLTEIKKRCEAATEGPWKGFDGFTPPELGPDDDLKWVRLESLGDVDGGILGYLWCDHKEENHPCHINFITHARTDVPMQNEMLLKTIKLIEKHGCFCEGDYTCFGCEWQPEIEKIAEKYK